MDAADDEQDEDEDEVDGVDSGVANDEEAAAAAVAGEGLQGPGIGVDARGDDGVE